MASGMEEVATAKALATAAAANSNSNNSSSNSISKRTGNSSHPENLPSWTPFPGRVSRNQAFASSKLQVPSRKWQVLRSKQQGATATALATASAATATAAAEQQQQQ